MIPASARPQTYALDRATTRIGQGTVLCTRIQASHVPHYCTVTDAILEVYECEKNIGKRPCAEFLQLLSL
jgi:hypothetical protein